GGTGAPDLDPRRRAGPRVGPRSLSQQARRRLRPAGGGAEPRGARGDLRRRDRDAARGGGRDPPAAPPRARALMHALAEPWSHGFMQRALLELVLLGIVGGVVGCWVLYYELAYSTESLAHALFPGLVGAALLGLPLLAGGAVGVLGAAVGVAVVRRTPLLGSDTSVAVVVTSLFGVGVLVALAPAAPPGLGGLLFGDLLGVTRADLISSGALAAGAATALVALHRPLLLVGFGRSTARAFGARPLLVDLALLAVVAVAIVIGVRALGNLLVVALLVG